MTDWNEHEDAISDAISDSIDMDWTSRTGAKAVVAWLNEIAPSMTRDAEHTPSPQSVVVDTFNGDNAALVRSIAALDQELIDRGLRTVRAYDAVRFLRDALSATTARLTGYDWNSDPDGLTKQQGDAFALADKVFADLSAAVDAHPDIELPECPTCGGTGKIEEAARTEGANQHSACVRSCEDCDGCGFAPDEEPSAILAALSPEAPAREMVALDKRIADAAERDRRERDKAFRGESYEPLTPRHEAPACEMCNGRGEVGGPTGQTPESFEYVTERCPDCGGTGKHEAPAEGAGEREEALGNLLAVIHGDGGHRALEVGVEQAAAEAEKIVARLLSSAPEAREGEAWPERWSGPCTVGNMISNLRTLPPEMPLYSAYHIPMDDQPSLLKVKRPTLSRERVDGTNIKTGDESIPYSAVIWSQPRDFTEATHPAAPSADKLREVLRDLMDMEFAKDWRTWSEDRATRLLGIGPRLNAFLAAREAALKAEGAK